MNLLKGDCLERMKEFNGRANINLHNGDCLEALRAMEDNAFELAIVDPPYGIGFDGENTSMSAGTRKDGTTRNMKSWSSAKPKGYKKKTWV